MTETSARVVGELAGRSGNADIVDVAVVESAGRRGDAIITSDPDDIGRVVAASRHRLRVESV